jgi:hypothetical protein
MMEDRKESRREVVKKMAYVAPIVLSLAASPAFARNGSGGGDSTETEPT